jgi:hypothetical protein
LTIVFALDKIKMVIIYGKNCEEIFGIGVHERFCGCGAGP